MQNVGGYDLFNKYASVELLGVHHQTNFETKSTHPYS